MRKINQEITDRSILENILKKSSICRMAMLDKELPYVLPFNYGYKDNTIYIHCAREGKKLQLLSKNSKVCFEIEGKAEIVRNDIACKWATAYRSIVGYGNVEILTDFAPKLHGLEIIMNHNGASGSPEFEPKKVDAVVVLKLTIENMTGKQSGNWNLTQNPDDFKLETDRLLLTEITLDDLDDIHNLHSEPKVDEFNTLGIPKSLDDTKKVVQSWIDSKFTQPRKSFTWKILLKETGEFIGLAGMSLSNNTFKLGEINYQLHPVFWNNGYATEVARRLVMAGFYDFHLNKVEAGVATENLRSIHVLEKTGMTREGLRRKILPIRGEWKDNYHYAIVNGDERDY